MEDRKDISRGRGFSIIQSLKRAQSAQSQSIGSSSSLSTSGGGDAQPPKPRGRAGVLETMRKMKELQIGASPNLPVQPVRESVTETVKEPEVVDKPVDFIGCSGKTVPASANYIRLKCEPEAGRFEYEVKFEPPVDAQSARNIMVARIIEKYSKVKAYNGHVLYLPVKVFDREVFIVKHPYDDVEVEMIIIYKRKLRMDECIQFYNVLFKRIMGMLKYKRVGQQFFDNKKPIPIPQHKLEIWPGYVTAVNEYSGGVMLCLDVSHRVLRTQNALHFMYETMQGQGGRAKDVITKALIGSVIMTRYNNQSYIIHDIGWDMNPLSCFDTDKGPVRYVDYYQKNHNIAIKDLKQPLLIHRKSERIQGTEEKIDKYIMLIPELSYMTGLTDGMRADMRIMKDIAQFTRVTPNQRMNAMRKYVQSVEENEEANNVLKSWGLKIDAATIDLQMRILDPETILFGNDAKIHGTEQADWTSAALKNHVMSAIDVHRWLLLYTAQDKRLMKEYCDTYFRLSNRMGITVSKPMEICMPDDRTETYVRVLQENVEPNVQLVVAICPTSRDDRYMAFKRLCCQRNPVASQIINSRTLKNSNKLPAITQKIALQINCKLGGTLWSVKFPFKNWMICGIDVYHSSASSGKSCYGFVSSLNDSMTRWYNCCCFQEPGKELGNSLKSIFVKALNEYRDANSCLPSHIVIYRDGVGDGQLNHCKTMEIEQLRSVFQMMNWEAKLIFIVVQKRILTRLFNYDCHRQALNPPAGSIADQHVTRKNYPDFYLVSQHVRQGTVTPTHYIILHNDTTIKPDNIQRLSYKLCHMYYNWTGTVRVPAPCQYAHKLASFSGQILRGLHSESLSTRLFYL